MPLQAVESQRLYRQIAEQLRSLIAGGEFAAGSRLPAERDLARQLGVSRPSVREALIALEVEGWVEVRVGSGIYIRPQGQPAGPGKTHSHVNGHAPANGHANGQAKANGSVALGAADWGPLELMRARELVEGEVAALAARHARKAQIAAMASALARMQEAADAGVIPREGDEAFHAAIAQACGNEVLRDTVMGYWQARSGPLFARMSEYFENPASWTAALAEHEQVLRAIHAHDAQAAREAMHLHLKRAYNRYSASWRRANSS
ncbi:MAG TPA: FadR/GntR family transcriptional regulator [Ramlibacter sp.]|jgi:DNA-binding FadR family transcriptional regulator|uniref:FadR/GntR family transcriptional regulator n=1 Tax=Ramlibacter sp. TaxID=1917967 RepID=UPI002D44A6AD|nr:FadR/GntR family transcriptional regulator [Ramlibacter sp.]HZY17482.1 FadR/GntR family transcriptional regulator [Ramlibacter sp.]